MGKFLETKYSGHQSRVLKKAGKSIQKCTTEIIEHHKIKTKRKNISRDQEPPLKKLRTEVNKDDAKDDAKDLQNHVDSEFQDLKVEVKINEKSNQQYLKLIRHDEDLFSDDDLKARYDQFTTFSLVLYIFEEIALEGLDGITIEAYWKRLNNALKHSTCIEQIKDYVWHIICANDKIKFYELPEPRQDLIILNRDAYLNKETNIFMEVYQTGPDIYKVEYSPKPINNTWGSCATLSTRLDISEHVRNMTLNDAYSTYKNKLVMVADQQLRKNALFDELTDPNYEYTQTEYCILERIGRSRELGEITQGPAALSNSFGIDAKSLYHYCKQFIVENLITKQFFCVRSTMDQNKIGRLLQLRRFYCKKKSKYMLLTETIINYLKKCPGYKAPYGAVKSLFVGPVHRKFFKNQEFMRYVNTQIFVPYKELYPDATYKEYMTKSLSQEREIHMMQLKDPFLNIVASWSDTSRPDSSDDEDENDDIVVGKGRILNMEFIREIYLLIHSKGKEGCNTQYINSVFNVDFTTIRGVLKKLVERNVVQCRKFDIGKQKHIMYMASSFAESSNVEVIQSTPIKCESDSVLERLKARQKQKIESLNKERVYTQEQFEADQQLMESPSLLPVTCTVPQLICEYLVSRFVHSTVEETILLAQFNKVCVPFKINLTYTELRGSIVINLAPPTEIENLQISEIKTNFKDFYCDIFKPDYLTKACLLQAHFGVPVNSKDIIELLDPSIQNSKQVGKRNRPIESDTNESHATTSNEDSVVNIKKAELANYMGPNPVLIWQREDEDEEVVSLLFLSTPPEAYKTGDIEAYTCPSDMSTTTDRVLSRIKLILKIINNDRVFEEVPKLLRVISSKELEEGYDKKMDRKSLYRIINRLINEGYIKIYQSIVSNKTMKKSQIYICHPEVSHSHEIIKNGIEQAKFKFLCSTRHEVEVAEPMKKKQKSPFGEYDVLQSIQEISELHPPKCITLKAISSKKAGKIYGFRPRFARMSLLHEILFYLIFVLDKDTKPIPKNEILELFNTYKINLTDEDLQHMPPVFCREISWKMFIPPLPRHLGWDEGWALICDIILRIPLMLMVRLYCINFLSTELQELLHHPIKRFYLLRNLPSQIHYLVMYKRKCIHDIHFILVRLAYCGLLQFGPSRFKEKDQGFVYLNRKASLLETMTSEPGYYKITDKLYNRLSFSFNTLESVSNYWFTMHNISMNTSLNARHVVEGKTITFIDVTAKPSLNKAVSIKTQEEVKKCDTGEIPGDNRGAAGLDSALWSHIQKNWFYFAAKSRKSFMDELDSLKLDKALSEQVSYEHLRLPPMPNKFYLSKPLEVKSVPVRKVKVKKTSKKAPIVKKIIAVNRSHLKTRKRDYYDAVDKAILRKYCGVRFRPTWSKEEDKILIILKLAALFLTPGTNKQLISYAIIRDILHTVAPESRSKTSRTVPRRWKILCRDVPLLANLQTLVLNLYKLVPVARYFVPLRNYIIKGRDDFGRKFKLTDPELHNAFIFFAYYLLNHRSEVETALHGNLTTMDYFNQENFDYTKTRILPYEPEMKYYHEPVSLEEIRKYVLKNIFHSALGHKNNHPAWSYQMYKVYRKFNQDILKDTIEELREQHMIQTKKEPLKKFFTPYKFSMTYVFSQTTLFPYHTMEEAYVAFSDLTNAPAKSELKTNSNENNYYGQMFAFNEVITCMMDEVSLKFWFPEHHFVLNPDIEDHSQVIEELAKRYQAKIRNDQRVDEAEENISTEKTYPQITNPEPGPSTSASEDIEILQFDDEEPLDLTITSTNSTTITNLKHWISDCIDTERVRSPSPELLTLDISHDLFNKKPKKHDDFVELSSKEEQMLNLEEIKKEIVRVTPPNEKRKVPYITELAKLLSENFDEIKTDETNLDEMKRHFVQQYPRLEELMVEGFNNHYIVDYLENRTIIKDIWKKVERDAHVLEPSSTSDAFDEILEKGGTIEDIDLASELINFVLQKEAFGAMASELQENLYQTGGNCTLEFILKILMNHNILVKTGVCAVRFVHYSHQTPWLADTFTLTDEHVNIFKRNNSKDKLNKLEEDIDECIRKTQWIKVKTVPWVVVDGTLDKDLFKVWLSSIFSHCIENPKMLLTSLFDKFCFLKPLDVFYLVEILQDLGCLEMRWFQPHFELFEEYEWSQDRKATLLDRFEEIYVETNQISFCSLGSFLNK